MYVIFFLVAIFKEAGLHVPSMEITVTSDIPIGAGLGSSAAFSVASTAALIQLQLGLQRRLRSDIKSVQDRICQWAFKSEKIIHGNPSGMYIRLLFDSNQCFNNWRVGNTDS